MNDTRVLLLADWVVDPHAVVAAAVRRGEHQSCSFRLVVPAWLHGLDWAGDTLASVPCAERQVADIVRLAHAAGLRLDGARVGDPEPAAAIGDALAEWPADEVLVCGRARRLGSHPFDLAHRARRQTGIPVIQVAA